MISNYSVFDSHFHIIDTGFPLISNDGYKPPAFTVKDYLKNTQPLNLRGGTVVMGSFQGYDQKALLSALQMLGSNFFGVTQLPFSVSDEVILALNTSRVRAIRFNIKRGCASIIEQMDALARRVFELVGWHSEIYIDSSELHNFYDCIKRLPAVSIDHLGLSRNGFSTLLKLVEQGVKVKASGFGRVDFAIPSALKSIHSINPQALMFGTDLPSTRAQRPFSLQDVDIILDTFEEQEAKRIFYDNAVEFYTFSPH